MTKLKLNVQGMSCAHCENAVATAVGALQGVKKVKASAKKAIVSVVYDEKQQNHDSIVKAITDEEFTVEVK